MGGGVVMAASAGLVGGCSSALPDETVVAWQGPQGDLDLRHWALSYALLAPSSHNLQSWVADVSVPDSIVLYVDRSRLLPMTDPAFRQIVVSQGTFIEALLIALRERGLDPVLEVFPEGEFAERGLDDRPVARIHWSPVGASPATKSGAQQRDPLFGQLLNRRTSRVPFDLQRPVAADSLKVLAAAVTMQGVEFGGTVDSGRVADLRELSYAASAVEFSTPRTMYESLERTRIGPDEISRHRDGITVNGVLARIASRVGLYDRETMPTPNSGVVRQTMDHYGPLCSSAMGFVWLSTPAASRSAQVAAGRAFMRVHLKASELGLSLQPLSQAPQEFPEMKPHYDRLHALLLNTSADQRVVQMFCRIGYAPEQPHSPRRPLDTIVRRPTSADFRPVSG